MWYGAQGCSHSYDALWSSWLVSEEFGIQIWVCNTGCCCSSVEACQGWNKIITDASKQWQVPCKHRLLLQSSYFLTITPLQPTTVWIIGQVQGVRNHTACTHATTPVLWILQCMASGTSSNKAFLPMYAGQRMKRSRGQRKSRTCGCSLNNL